MDLNMTPRLADLLRTNSMRSFYTEQADRFELIDGPPPNIRATMHWCATAADALLLRAYELGQGHDVSLLADLESDDSWVVLTSQPFDDWARNR